MKNLFKPKTQFILQVLNCETEVSLNSKILGCSIA